MTWKSALLLVIVASSAYGYEVNNHSAIAKIAADRSVLKGESATLSELGLRDFDSERLPAIDGAGQQSIVDLIGLGAEFEDGNQALDRCWTASCLRPLNHFYDPQHEGRGLTYIVALGYPSLEWALEDESLANIQDHSFRDARENLLCGLAGKVVRTEPGAVDLVCQGAEARRAALGRAFNDIGQTIHHLADMAQPQHVRNEQHLWDGEIDGVHNTFYEAFTKVNLDVASLPTPPLVPPAIDVRRARDLWVNEASTGIAEFTSQNFVSPQYNFIGAPENGVRANPEFDFPSPAGVSGPEPSTAQTLDGATFVLGDVNYVRSLVLNVGGTPPAWENPHAATYSIFSDDLTETQCLESCEGPVCLNCALFVLNSNSFKDAWSVLVPRAIAASTALIDYFFRGRIDAERDPANPTRLTIVNRSREPMSGVFRLYYDDENGDRWAVPGAAFSTAGLPAGALSGCSGSPLVCGEMSVVSPPEPSNPPPAVRGEYMLVFEGTMGDEAPAHGRPGAVVGKRISLPPEKFVNPAGILSYDRASEEWGFEARAGALYGNTDWHGRAGTVSWVGPWGRYVGLRPAAELGPYVFAEGQVLATAPGPVIGAALDVEDDASAAYLTVIVALMDANSRAVGEKAWRTRIDTGSVDWAPGPQLDYDGILCEDPRLRTTERPAHYFFNASGTEAQSVKIRQTCLSDGRDAYRSVTFSWSTGFQVEPRESQPAVTHVDETSSGGECCAAATRTDPHVICVSTSSSSHYVHSEQTSWIVAADYRGDDLVLAVSNHSSSVVSDGVSAQGSLLLTTSAVESGDLDLGDGELPLIRYESYSSQTEVGSGPTCQWSSNPDACDYFNEGACSYLAGDHQSAFTQTLSERELQYLDLRTSPATAVYRHVRIDFSQPDNGNNVSLEVPSWLVNGEEDDLAPSRPADSSEDPLPPSIATDSDGRVILEWSDFGVCRLFPDADPEELSGVCGPVGVL